MIKLKVITMSGIKNEIVDETRAIKDILEELEVSYAGRTLTLDGYALTAAELAEPLQDLGVGEKAVIGVSAKTENAANATVIGNAMVVTSAQKLEDLKTVKKYRPEALTLYKEEKGEKEAIFKIGFTDKDGGSINKYGATFSQLTDAEGHARLTMTFGPDLEQEDLVDELGPALLKLKQLEETLDAELAGIAEDKAAAAAAITFA